MIWRFDDFDYYFQKYKVDIQELLTCLLRNNSIINIKSIA